MGAFQFETVSTGFWNTGLKSTAGEGVSILERCPCPCPYYIRGFHRVIFKIMFYIS